MKQQLSPHLQSLLWEYDLNALHFDDPIVIERILKFGALEDYRQLQQHIGKQALIDFFIQHRASFDHKTANFWEVLFNLPHLPSSYHTLYEQMNKPLFLRGIRP
jgi:hypothetical protein